MHLPCTIIGLTRSRSFTKFMSITCKITFNGSRESNSRPRTERTPWEDHTFKFYDIPVRLNVLDDFDHLPTYYNHAKQFMLTA